MSSNETDKQTFVYRLKSPKAFQAQSLYSNNALNDDDPIILYEAVGAVNIVADNPNNLPDLVRGGSSTSLHASDFGILRNM